MDATTAIDIEKIRTQFPVLHQKVNGKPLIYFDNAATNQKPQQVIDALVSYYQGYNANIHRGIHTLAEKATKAFEATRHSMQKFINAKHVEEIIFTRGVTESINLVASSYGRAFLGEGDEVIVFGEPLSVAQLSNWAGTIAYEIMTGISQRVKRVYYEEG